MPSNPDYLLEPEFETPFNDYMRTKSPEHASALLKAVDPIVSSSLRTYGATGSPTLKSRAKIITLGALDKYDPSKSKLKTHLMSQLQGMRRFAAKEQQIVNVPEQIGLESQTLRNAENELRDKLGRDPSDVELSDHISLPIKRIEYIRSARPAYAEGALARLGNDGESVWSPAIQDQKNNTTKAWHDLVYHDLEPRDQVIMEHTLGLHGKRVLTNQEIANKLKISPGAISQRKSRIQGKLDLRDELGVL